MGYVVQFCCILAGWSALGCLLILNKILKLLQNKDKDGN